MRVAHIITRLVVGGAQENTLSTIAGLRQKDDLEISLISGPTTGPEGSLESQARQIVPLTIIPELVRPVHPWKDLIAYRKLIRALREQRPHLVHTHSGKAGILGRLAAQKARVPAIVHHIHGPSFGPWQSAAANLIFKNAERVAGRVTDHFLCSAAAMSRLYLAAGIGRPESYTRIFSGFNIQPFLKAQASDELRKRLDIGENDFVIGKIARLAPLKGHSDLIQAASLILPQCPQARFLVIGDGRLRAEVEAQVRATKFADRFVFTGLIPPDAVPAHVAIMDCLVHLSYREALSRALPQALAAGKPVVAYNFDGADEVCLEGETGFVIEQGDVAEVARRLLQLAQQPGLREQMGSKGRELVRDSFTVEHMVDAQYSVYRRVAASRDMR
jgi:glycosyltransferase involved in cell wall biosynthesis